MELNRIVNSIESNRESNQFEKSESIASPKGQECELWTNTNADPESLLDLSCYHSLPTATTTDL